MRVRILSLISSLAVVALALAACGDAPRANRVSDADAATDIAASRVAFAAVDLFKMSYRLEADGVDATIEGDGAYAFGEVVYGQTTYVDVPAADDDVTHLLFLPPDLYLEEADGDWIVMSPWNQGVRPDEQEPLYLDAPIIDYEQFTRDLDDVERKSGGEADAVGLERYTARMLVQDLQALAPGDGTGGRASVELWLQQATKLPVKVTISASGASATIEFSDYGQLVAAPPRPESAQAVRDAQLPDAPCAGEGFDACLAAQTAIAPTGGCEGVGRRVCLAPLGLVSPGLVLHLADHYRAQYGLEIVVLPPHAIPPEMADPLRKQVDASALIEYAGTLFPDAYNNVDTALIVITPTDIYNAESHFRFVFGVKGTPANPQGVVSTFRFDPQTYGELPDDEMLYTRTRKFVSKYIGLLYYGLPVSRDPNSPMFDAILSLHDLDRMTEPLPVSGG